MARLAEELEESGLPLEPDQRLRTLLLEEVDRALRPEVHERHVPSGGAIVEPRAEPKTWATGTQLDISHVPIGAMAPALGDARRYADGLSSWLVRRTEPGQDDFLLFDRPAGSERDLVVLAQAMEATVVQRHPAGTVRIVGPFGVLRWEGLRWHHEPPITTWLDSLGTQGDIGDFEALEALLRLAVHDLGALGIGALLICQLGTEPAPRIEERLSSPPPLCVRKARHLAPLRHALAQVDGAAIFDGDGVLRRLGVELLPNTEGDRLLPPWHGTRHTAALRYSNEDATSVVIVVSEDGPVTVVRKGAPIERATTH
jgi:sensor domain DACNK-containing protein/DisA checkpoint controller-like protein